MSAFVPEILLKGLPAGQDRLDPTSLMIMVLYITIIVCLCHLEEKETGGTICKHMVRKISRSDAATTKISLSFSSLAQKTKLKHTW